MSGPGRLWLAILTDEATTAFPAEATSGSAPEHPSASARPVQDIWTTSALNEDGCPCPFSCHSYRKQSVMVLKAYH